MMMAWLIVVDQWLETATDILCAAFWAIVGGLPKGDHNIFTNKSTSIPAIEKGLKLLKSGGMMTLIIYYGRETGFEERDALLEELWKRFGDVPMDPSTETMEAPFLDFPAGTSRVDIWRWFDERHSKGVAYLLYNEDASNAASITSLLHCQKLCTECDSETCVFNPQGICMAPFLTGRKPGVHDDGCTDYCPKPLDGCEPVRSYSEYELRSYEEDVREYISQFTDEELMEAYELDRTTLNALAPRAAVLMRKYIDNDDSWTYHRDYAISEAVSEYKEDKNNA